MTVRGHFEQFEGSYDVTPDGASIQLTIDAGSVDTGHAKRDEHLRSADFFKGQTIPGCDSTPRGWTTSARACCACTGQLEAAGTSVPLEFGCPGHRAG